MAGGNSSPVSCEARRLVCATSSSSNSFACRHSEVTMSPVLLEHVMQIDGFLWLPQVVDKLDWKHNVDPAEVEQVFSLRPHFRKVQRGHVPGEDLYAALGRTSAGRYLIAFFILKTTREALVISARDMDRKERTRYGRQGK